MSRTFRFDRRLKCKVADGKQSYQCRCSWCMSQDKQRAITTLHLKEVKDTLDGQEAIKED